MGERNGRRAGAQARQNKATMVLLLFFAKATGNASWGPAPRAGRKGLRTTARAARRAQRHALYPRVTYATHPPQARGPVTTCPRRREGPTAPRA